MLGNNRCGTLCLTRRILALDRPFRHFIAGRVLPYPAGRSRWPGSPTCPPAGEQFPPGLSQARYAPTGAARSWSNCRWRFRVRHRQGAAGRRRDTVDMALQLYIRQHVETHGGGLSRANVFDLHFAVVRLDIDIVQRNHGEERAAYLHVIADAQCALPGDAVDGRTDLGTGKLELCRTGRRGLAIRSTWSTDILD